MLYLYKFLINRGICKVIYFILMIIGILILFNKEKLLKYDMRIDAKGGMPVKREIRNIKIIVMAVFLIIFGLIGLIR